MSLLGWAIDTEFFERVSVPQAVPLRMRNMSLLERIAYNGQAAIVNFAERQRYFTTARGCRF
jgi:hypothetical protein